MQKATSILALVCTIFVCSVAYAQEPVPFRQFYFNPYLFNPSYNASSGFTEISVVYRKQWVNFNDAPTIAGLNVQIPTKSKVSVGFNFISQEVIALRNSTLMATFGYAIPLAENQFLRFGLSGGLGMNNLNLKEGEYDPNDPVIINALQNNYYVDGNFGVSYQLKGLNIGFALPHLFKPPFVSSSEFSADEFSPMDNQLASASYKFRTATGQFSIEPIFIYRNSNNLQLHSFDFGALLHFKEKISLGGTYGTAQGPGFFLGMNLGTFRFSYSFELPPSNTNFINTNSHEIQLSARLGKKRVPQYAGKKKQTPTTEPTQEAEQPTRLAETKEKKEEPVPVQEAKETNQPQPEHTPTPTDDSVKKEITENQVTPREEIPLQKPPIESITPGTNSPPRTFKLSQGHYVVAGVFKVMQNAISYAQDLALKGYAEATVAIHPENDLYYVYIFSSYDIDAARKMRNQLRLRRPLNEAWILTIEKPEAGN